LSSSLSDHCPILMSTAMRYPSKRRFRFERFWIKMAGFSEMVEASWASGSPPSDPFQRLDYRMRKLAKDLQRWHQKRVGSVRD
jgi:hypothetical protein